MDATAMFLTRHDRLHTRLQRLTDDLGEEQVRGSVQPGVNPIAWQVWHIARGEDGAMSLLVCDGPQVFDDGWSERLCVPRRDVGTGMTAAEVAEVSAAVDLSALRSYARAVGQHTRRLVAAIGPADLDEVVTDARVRRAVDELVTGPALTELPRHWRGLTRGHFLVWLALTHSYEHLGQADLARGMLGLPGHI